MNAQHKHNLFSRLFPPPDLLTMPSVGLDISSHSIRMLELVETRRGLLLGRHAERKIPPAALYSVDAANSADSMKANEEVVRSLRSLKKEFNLHFVNVSLPEDKSYIFSLSLPNAASTNIRESIEFQLEENVPIAPADAIFTYSILNPTGTDHTEVTVVVFPKKFIENIIELLKDADLVPVSFSIAADAVARAVVIKGSPDTTMIVNIGEINTGISIVSNGIVQFTSTLTFGGEALTSGIQKQFSVDKDEAIRIKKNEDFLKDKKSMEIFFSLMNPISALRDEINRVLAYWQTHKIGNAASAQSRSERQVSRIVLCGSDSCLRGLDEYLSLSMKVPVETANVWVNAFRFDTHIPDIPFSDSLNYAAAIGLALKGI